MYELLLTHSERAAIDWIGNRYSHGYDFYKLLCDCTREPDVDWDDDRDILFTMRENIAWSIVDCLEEDEMACFADSLVQKLVTFMESVV